jgi:hypothetical protein
MRSVHTSDRAAVAPATQTRATSAAGNHSVRAMLSRAQRGVGNQAVSRHLTSEAQADQVAERVMATQEVPSPASLEPARSSPSVRGGQVLDARSRAFMEPRFGRSFADVRVFTEGDAAASARWMAADAYTVDRSIVFAPGRYAPETHAGRTLLAHELTHVLQQETMAPRIQRQRGRLEPFDARYRLYVSHAGTQYHAEAGDFELSAWDLSHLVREHGFYFIEGAGQRSLITPPEVRRAAHRRGHGGSGVLLPFSADDEQRFSADPVGTVEALAQERLGIRVATVTSASGADRDFTIPAIPPAMTRALAGGGTADGAEARRDAATTPQARTPELAAQRGEQLPMEDMTRADSMSPSELAGMTPADRAAWYVAKLGKYQAQLYASAQRHHIPVQLLAVVILNELADINVLDWAQAGPTATRGSLGIAQIQVTTAITDRLVDPPANAPPPRRTRRGALVPAPLSREHVGQQLQIPQVAIEAAAREIEILLLQMIANRRRLWQQRSDFTAARLRGDEIYDFVGDPTEPLEAREGLLARMVSAAYNSPQIIVSPVPDPSRYRNANIHGNNARLRAMELYRLGLFRTQALPTVPRSRVVEPITSLEFDGATLTVNGTATTSFAALSGVRANNPHSRDRRDHTGADSQDLPLLGPIPSGDYYIDPVEIEHGGFPEAVWGPTRIRIHGTAVTDLRRRLFTNRDGGFFIHQDVRRDGTAGCVGLQSTRDTERLFARIAQTTTRIPLTVTLRAPVRR